MGCYRFTTEDGCSLLYEDVGSGLPVLWQHGLCADRRQPAQVFPARASMRRITLECRGHGESQMGDTARLSIAQFAQDAAALLDHLGIGSAVVGGISLGAAIALRLAVKFPSPVIGLILARPAWVSESAPVTLRPYLLAAEFLDKYGREEGLRIFEQSQAIADLDTVSPDNGTSLRGLFSRQNTESTIELLSRIPNDGPGLSCEEISAIAVPTLILANKEDYVHPVSYAAELAALIPGADLQIIASKTVDQSLYYSEFSSALASFLQNWTVAGGAHFSWPTSEAPL